MIPAYEEVALRINDELADMDRCVVRAGRSWELARRADLDQDAYVDSVALNLHSFYTALERLFEIIARQVDADAPGEPRWHSALIQQMATGREGIRPAVITSETQQHLDELRRFRHLVRHVYADRLDPQRIAGLVADMDDLWPRLAAELRAFAAFLRDVSAADDALA